MVRVLQFLQYESAFTICQSQTILTSISKEIIVRTWICHWEWSWSSSLDPWISLCIPERIWVMKHCQEDLYEWGMQLCVSMKRSKHSTESSQFIHLSWLLRSWQSFLHLLQRRYSLHYFRELRSRSIFHMEGSWLFRVCHNTTSM